MDDNSRPIDFPPRFARRLRRRLHSPRFHLDRQSARGLAPIAKVRGRFRHACGRNLTKTNMSRIIWLYLQNKSRRPRCLPIFIIISPHDLRVIYFLAAGRIAALVQTGSGAMFGILGIFCKPEKPNFSNRLFNRLARALAEYYELTFIRLFCCRLLL